MSATVSSADSLGGPRGRPRQHRSLGPRADDSVMKTRRHLGSRCGGRAVTGSLRSGDDYDRRPRPQHRKSSRSRPRRRHHTAPATTTATTEPGITSFDHVQPAVIQILATGTIRDPEIGTATTAGAAPASSSRPTGWPSRTTTSSPAPHEVFIGGDTDRATTPPCSVFPSNWRCPDHAETAGVTWQESDPTVGQEVYAAGSRSAIPSHDDEGHRRQGRGRGDTPWARSTTRSSTTPTSSPATRADR